MLRFKQFLIEYTILLEDKATDFANRYAKVHAEHPKFKEDPDAARELFKQAMQWSQNPDEAEFLTRQFLEGTIKPGEDDATIGDVLGNWRKAVKRNLSQGKRINQFSLDDLQEFFGKNPEVFATGKVAKASNQFERYKIGEITLPETEGTFDSEGKPISMQKGSRLNVHRIGSDATPEELETFRVAMKKSCPPGSTWCVLANPEYMDQYSKGSGFFLYTDESGRPVFAHGYGDRGVVDTKNRVLKSSGKVSKETVPLITDDRARMMHKPEYSAEELEELLRDKDIQMKKLVFKNSQLPEEIADKIVKDNDMLDDYMRSPHFRDRHLRDVLNSSNPRAKIKAMNYSRNLDYGEVDPIDDDLFERLLIDPDYNVRKEAANREVYNRNYDRVKRILDAEDSANEKMILTSLQDSLFDMLSAPDEGPGLPTSPEVMKKKLELRDKLVKSKVLNQGLYARVLEKSDLETATKALDARVKNRNGAFDANDLIPFGRNANISDELFDQYVQIGLEKFGDDDLEWLEHYIDRSNIKHTRIKSTKQRIQEARQKRLEAASAPKPQVEVPEQKPTSVATTEQPASKMKGSDVSEKIPPSTKVNEPIDTSEPLTTRKQRTPTSVSPEADAAVEFGLHGMMQRSPLGTLDVAQQLAMTGPQRESDIKAKAANIIGSPISSREEQESAGAFLQDPTAPTFMPGMGKRERQSQIDWERIKETIPDSKFYDSLSNLRAFYNPNKKESKAQGKPMTLERGE